MYEKRPSEAPSISRRFSQSTALKLLHRPVVATFFYVALMTVQMSSAQTAPVAQQPDCIPISSNCADVQGIPPSRTNSTPAVVSNFSSPQSDQRNDSAQSLYIDRSDNGIAQPREDRGSSQQPDPITDLQRLARSSTGQFLPIFGRDLFQSTPSTFAPGDQIAVAPDYTIGNGDDVLLRIWGSEVFNGQLTVDRSGSIYIPKIGAVHVAGLRFDELQDHIKAELSRTYRNFDISVNLGRLRSIQIYVVGEARHPGAYTISSLSTVLNALFASGGPDVQGSLRHIQVRRTGQPAAEFDLYDFVLHGDKSKDIRLETGDTIFIPAAGPQVALAGSVRHPAIFELNSRSTIQEIIDLAGGFSPTASNAQISLERIHDDFSRYSISVALDVAGRSTPLHDGDVLYVGHISAAYEKTVAIRGNLANPGRFPWHEGMRLSDIIPDRMSLLTSGYWDERNRLGLPVSLFTPSNGETLGTIDSENSTAEIGQENALPSSQVALQAKSSVSTLSGVEPARKNSPGMVVNRTQIRLPAPEIDWSYAVIERLDPTNLKNILIPFNLGKLVQGHDPAQNLELHPGDTVTVLSQRDIQVPLEQQTKYIRLEGEFAGSGVYSVKPGETLSDVVRRAGGLTTKAYLYGSNFTRESARVFQQQRLDEYVESLSADMERAAATRTVASANGVSDPTAIAEQRLLITRLQQLRATGRIVLEFKPESSGLESIPNLPLEDGDVFRVPPTPSTVSVVGSVYGQNIFLYNASRRLEEYVSLAGRPNRVADSKHAYIIRADGSIYSRDSSRSTFSNRFDTAQIYPGDSIVIPEKLIKPPLIRSLIDYSQILSSFGLAAAAINVLQ